MNQAEIAMDELKLLQEIIARQDEFKARTKNWAVTLVAAIATLYSAHDAKIGHVQFLSIAVLMSFAFLVIEAIFGATESLAEDRVRVVEQSLRTKDAAGYDGPNICESMLKRITFGRVLASMCYLRTFALYAFLIAFTVVAMCLRIWCSSNNHICHAQACPSAAVATLRSNLTGSSIHARAD